MSTSKPTARVAVNRNVVKTYGKANEQKVYLPNDTEFGIEFLNPTKDVICAEVHLNGKRAFDQVLVLKPGEREWLDCDPSTMRKFLFSTYNVEGDNKAVEEAIANNGDLEVKFYRERVEQQNVVTTTTIVSPGVWPPIDNWPTFKPQYPSNGDLTNGGNIMYCSTTNSLGDQQMSDNQRFVSANVSDIKGASIDHGEVTMDWMEQEQDRSLSVPNPNKRSKKRSKSKGIEYEQQEVQKVKETGRVEAGSESDQSFSIVDYSFSAWSFYTDFIQILPSSQQPVNTKVSANCGSCRKKLKRQWKVCPNCATVIA